MEDNYDDDLKKELLNTLDMETNKETDEINTNKVSAIVKLLDVLDSVNKKDKSDSLEKFIHKFNKAHNTNLTADTRLIRRRKKLSDTLALFGVLTLICILLVFLFEKRKKL